MKFSAQIALACFSAGALANVAPRALSDFQAVLTTVQTDVDKLDSEINAFEGDASPVQAAATTLVDDLSNGNIQLSGQPVLSLADSFTLDGQVNSFKTHVNTLAGDLKTRRPDVIAAGQCELVRENIHAINTAADNLMGTIVSKVDSAVKSVGEKQKSEIQAILDGCKADYTTENCP